MTFQNNAVAIVWERYVRLEIHLYLSMLSVEMIFNTWNGKNKTILKVWHYWHYKFNAQNFKNITRIPSLTFSCLKRLTHDMLKQARSCSKLCVDIRHVCDTILK